jgi:multidrug efflux system outer membrane protein
METTEMKNRALLSLLATLLIAGCTAGPNYKRPKVDVPSVYRGAAADQTNDSSLGDQKWSEVYPDEELQGLIRTALQQNYDVRIAAARILQAQAQLGITRADQLPSVAAGASASDQRAPRSKIAPASESNANQVSIAFAWELDFWGKFRRSTEAARADLLTSEWAREQVISTLVSDIATAYFQLRELDLELEISQSTLGSRRDSLKLTQLLADHGATSMLDVRQAEQLVFTAAEQVPDLERRIEQQENLISVLLGKNPGTVTRGRKLIEQPHAPEVPAGLTSALLERRPDIRQAEQRLIASNARIGVAKAAFFPQLSLTADGGFQSSALTSLFSGPAGLWSFGGALTQPIFEGGRLRNNVRLTEAREQEALLVYRQTIQEAFREVSDALVGYRKSQEFRVQQELLTRSAQDAAHLSDIRYQGGAASYLEVLTNQTNYFSAELNLAQAQRNELLALVTLYKALGGGWRN